MFNCDNCKQTSRPRTKRNKIVVEKRERTYYSIIVKHKKVKNEFLEKDHEEIFQFCRIINDSKPLVLPDHPRYFIIAKNITEILQQKYYAYFSASARPSRPNLNADQFSQQIAKLIAAGENPYTLYDKIEKINTEYEVITANNYFQKFMYPGETEQIVKKYVNLIQKKAVSQKFYLGLYKNYEWTFEISPLLNSNQYKNDICVTESEKNESTRVHLTKTQRRFIWNTKIGKHKIEGKCYVCNRNLDVESFHVGHKRAVVKGGNNDMDNLEIVCYTCNFKMGTMDLEDFKKHKYSTK